MSVSHISSGSHSATHVASNSRQKAGSTVAGSASSSHKTTSVASGKQGSTVHAVTKHPAVAVSHSATPTTSPVAPKLATIGKVGTKLSVTA